MLNPLYHAPLVSAVFGAEHATTFPDTWSLAWFDEFGAEITGTGYARVPVLNDATVWGLSTDTVVNVVDIAGGTPGAGDWPAIYTMVLFDEFGTAVITQLLTAPVTPVSGTPVVLLAGDVVVAVNA